MKTKYCIVLAFFYYQILVATGGRPYRQHERALIYDEDSLHFKNPRNVPSDQCPRDEAQAKIQERTCLRKCNNDDDCKSKKKKCLCDGPCGMSCIKPDKECGEPEPPRDIGTVKAIGKIFGSKAVYHCPDGYNIVGMEERICQADGTWSGGTPTCKKNIYCTEPLTIENARHNAPSTQTTFNLEESLQYQCLPGYITKGFARSKCFLYNGTARWFGPDITCEPKSCGSPQDILNGHHEKTCYHFGCNLTYTCQPGFEIVGQIQHFCNEDGNWTPKDLPACIPVQCHLPRRPMNGDVVFTSTSFNSEVTYKCDYGYMLVGEATRRCGPDKIWSGSEPVCKEINCGSPGILHNGWLEGSRTTLHAVVVFHCLPTMTFEGTSDRSICQSDGTWSHSMPNCFEIDCGHPGDLHNGWLENLDRGTGLGASVIFRCHESMTLIGHSSSICQIDGKWRYQLPKCYAPCRVPEVPFGNATTPVEAQLESSSESENSTAPKHSYLQPGSIITHGKSIGVQCEEKYEPAFNIDPPTCHNGSWTNEPTCQPARCKGLPKVPKHGMVIAPKTEHGMRAKFRCRDGYVLVGSNVTQCLYGEWTDDTPYCNQTFCRFPGSIPNGRVLLVGNMGLYDYRNYVTKVANNRQIKYDCDKGYMLIDGPPGKTCIRGEWSPPAKPPKCVPSQHPGLRWMRSIREKRRAIKTGGSSVVRGSKAGGGGGGGISTRRGNKKRYRYNENDHFETSPMTCDTFEDDPYIQAEVIKKGSEDNQTYASGTVVKVSCTKGFGVNLPNQTIQCKNGDWRPKEPKCSALPCQTPYIPHGTFYETKKALYFQEYVQHMTAVIIKCSKGYILKGPSRLNCWYGEWDVEQAPRCLPYPCSIPALDYGKYHGPYKAGQTVHHETMIDYSCSGDYRKIVSSPVMCNLGEWKPMKPFCVKSSTLGEYDMQQKRAHQDKGDRPACSRPPKEPNALIYVEGMPIDYSQRERTYTEGTEAAYRCANLKPKRKNRLKIYCDNGTWVYPPNKAKFSCEEGEIDADELTNELISKINGPCTYKKDDPNVVTFFDGAELRELERDFTTNTSLISRCIDIGKFRMHGAGRRECASGQWLGVTPKCEGLSQLHDYALDKPPTILFRYENGTFLQSNDGKLLIYTGTTVHMECLWIKKFGTPKWKVSNEHRIYNEGWATGEHRNSGLEYRLTIDNAQPEDSGIYRCITPARHGHEVQIVVKKMDCDPLPHRDDLVFSTDKTKFGIRVKINCTGSNEMFGPSEITCLDNGKWSDGLPYCQHVECPDISLLPAMAPSYKGSVAMNASFDKNESASPPKIILLGRQAHDKAIFECPQGLVPQGPAESICQSNGEWSNPIPICKEVECPEPIPPENGHVTSGGPYKAGSFAQFECDKNFAMESQQMAAMVCQDSGTWSKNAIKCVKSCTYPGSLIGGSISKVSYFYKIGETIEFDCNQNYRLEGARMIHCKEDGKWSQTIPQCIPLDM